MGSKKSFDRRIFATIVQKDLLALGLERTLFLIYEFILELRSNVNVAISTVYKILLIFRSGVFRYFCEAGRGIFQKPL